jgi:hypothetical protein
MRVQREQREQRHSVRAQDSVDRFVIANQQRIEAGCERGIGKTNAKRNVVRERLPRFVDGVR